VHQKWNDTKKEYKRKMQQKQFVQKSGKLNVTT